MITYPYPTVAGKLDELHPKCRICLHLIPMPVIAKDYYGCGKGPLMYPDVCPWFTDASWKKEYRKESCNEGRTN